MTRIRTFRDLEVWKKAFKLAVEVIHLAEKPAKSMSTKIILEQLLRASTSISANIAEGYGRYHYLDSLRFYYIARGSLTETLSAFVTCEAIGYLTKDELVTLRSLVHSALRSLNGYIRYVRNARQGHQEYGTQLLREDQPIYHVPQELLPDEE